MIYTEKGQTLAINVYLVVMVLIIWEYVVTMAIIGKYTDIASMKAFGASFSFCHKFSNAVMILHAPTFPSCLLNILIPLTFHFSVSTCWLGCALACFDCHFFTYIKLACIASPWLFSLSPSLTKTLPKGYSAPLWATSLLFPILPSPSSCWSPFFSATWLHHLLHR